MVDLHKKLTDHLISQLAPGSHNLRSSLNDTLPKSTLTNIILNHFDNFKFKKGTPDLTNILNNSEIVTFYCNDSLMINTIRSATLEPKDITFHDLPDLKKEQLNNIIYNMKLAASNSVFTDDETIFQYIPSSNIVYLPRRTKLDTIFGEQTSTALLFLLQLNNPAIKITKNTMRLPTLDVQQKVIKDIETKELRYMFENIKYTNEDQKRNKINRTKMETEDKITDLHNQIKELDIELMAIEKRSMYPNNEDYASILLDLVERNVYLDSITVVPGDTNLINIKTRPLKLLKWDKAYLEKSFKRMYPNTNSTFKKALKKFKDNEADMYFGTYNIQLSINTSGKLGIRSSNNEPYANPHQRIGCLGTYSTPVNQQKRSNNIVGLILIYLEYLQSINFPDSGSHNLDNCCYIIDKQGKELYNAYPNHKQESPTENTPSDEIHVNEGDHVVGNNRGQEPTRTFAEDASGIQYTQEDVETTQALFDATQETSDNTTHETSETTTTAAIPHDTIF